MHNIELIEFTDKKYNYELMYKWCSQEFVYKWFEQRKLSLDEVKNKYKSKLLEKRQNLFFINYNKIKIGFVQIYKYDDKKTEKLNNYNSIFEYDIFIGKSEYLSKGIGTQIVNYINEYIYENYTCDCIILRPFKKNERAIKCYEKCNFKKIDEYIITDTLGNKENIVVLLNKLDRWTFGTDIDKLVNLVLEGKKSATTYLYKSNDILKVGDISILIDSKDKDVCILKTSKVIVNNFKNITWDLAKLEGEYDNLEDWKKNHINYFKLIDNNFTENTKVAIEIFKVVKIFKNTCSYKNIYIDFDGTLFDTDKYTSDFMNIFSEYGINKEIFEQVKDKLFNSEKLFDLDIIADYFIKTNNVDINLKCKIDNLLNNFYVYPEVTGCLEQLINSGYKLYLLTYGNNHFQTKKINSSNLSKYFEKIIITNKDKSELNLNYANSIFIDNNPYVIEKLYIAKAQTLIRVRRSSDRYMREKCNINNIIECRDFNEVVECLKGGFKNE